MSGHPTRRSFLASSARTAGWLTLLSGPLASLAACARDDAAEQRPFTNLTPEEGRAVRAFARQILPSGDGLPGAEEAGAAHFVDRAVVELFPPMRPLVGQATAALDGRAGADAFADLDDAGQREVLEELEDEGWFGGLRFLVLAGVFSHPSYGGNRDGAGFRLLGMETAPAFQPPFGAYDARYDADAGAGGVG